MKLIKHTFFVLVLALLVFVPNAYSGEIKGGEGTKVVAPESASQATSEGADAGNEAEKKSEDEVSLKDIRVIIETNHGEIELKFFPDVAPKHVKNFIDLSESGFYDGTIFHRVIPGFMIQGGDPNTKGTDTSTYGMGGPEHSVDAEFNKITHTRGILSMARSQHPNSAGSQFFIVVKNSTFLDNKYTVFGKVVRGMDVVDKIVSLPRNTKDPDLPRDLPNERVEMKMTVYNVKDLSDKKGN